MTDNLPKYLEQTAVRSILEEAYRRSARDGLMFELTYLYGLRVSELVKLDRTHFKRGAGRLLINRSKGALGGEIPLFAHLIPTLDAYLTPRGEKLPSLFAGRQGRLTTRRVQDLFDATALAAGITLNAGQGIHCL